MLTTDAICKKKNYKTIDTSDDERLIFIFILEKDTKKREEAQYITIRCREHFVTLCYGPHVENT